MGSELGRTACADVVWASEERSPETHDRASLLGLEDVGSIEEMVRRVEMIVSVCPPSAAEDVAGTIAGTGYDGIYVDGNAISPATSARIAQHFDRFVDGSLIGPPPTTAGTTRFYLCGDDADVVAEVWAGSDLAPVVIEGPVGAASALKVAYAGWTKGSAALLVTMAAYAREAGVGSTLRDEWDLSIPGLSDRLARTAAGVGPKAWRFTGEMDEIAWALEELDLPAGFHEAAAEIYTRMADLRRVESPDVETAIDSLFDA